MQVAGDGEKPWTEARVGAKAPGVLHKAQPGLFKQVFCDIASVRQSDEKVVQAAIEGIMHRIERLGFARSQAADELELNLTTHQRNNAESAET
jgi:hypothetical protein